MPRTVRTMLLAAALLIPLVGCATTGSGGTESVCGPWQAITWSSRDTPETVDGIKGNNARRGAWCQ